MKTELISEYPQQTSSGRTPKATLRYVAESAEPPAKRPRGETPAAAGGPPDPARKLAGPAPDPARKPGRPAVRPAGLALARAAEENLVSSRAVKWVKTLWLAG